MSEDSSVGPRQPRGEDPWNGGGGGGGGYRQDARGQERYSPRRAIEFRQPGFPPHNQANGLVLPLDGSQANEYVREKPQQFDPPPQEQQHPVPHVRVPGEQSESDHQSRALNQYGRRDRFDPHAQPLRARGKSSNTWWCTFYKEGISPAPDFKQGN